MGGIFYSPLASPTKNIDFNNFALPLFPNMKQPPTHNEVVQIISLPNPFSQLKVNKTTKYYFQPVNIWNSIHHYMKEMLYMKVDGVIVLDLVQLHMMVCLQTLGLMKVKMEIQ